MTLSVHFQTRDFALPVITGCQATPHILSWSARGGPDQAVIKLNGAFPDLLKCLSLLRCPVEVADHQSSPVWWGYVYQVTLLHGESKFTVTLDDLFNRVKVIYSFASPDTSLTEYFEATSVDDPRSQSEYGIRETIIKKLNIDQDFADNLRDTFLASHAYPQTILTASHHQNTASVTLTCHGWFISLGWQSYETQNGYHANLGPGPGSFLFGQASTALYPSQSFIAAGSSSLKYVYFLLRKFGNPTQNISVALSSDSGGSIGTPLIVSNPISATTLTTTAFEWIRFEFSTPYALSSGTKYWLTIDQNGVSSTNYFAIRLDENMGYGLNQGLYYNGSSFVQFPTVTHPSGIPDTFFRAVCVQDTGTQLYTIASTGNQFFDKILSLPTGVSTCPFRASGKSCLQEIESLMDLGTSNNRPILSAVSSYRHLLFYEQPDPSVHTVYMNRQGQFFTTKGKQLKPYTPPVGQFASYTGTDLITSPWDNRRVPLCFVSIAKYNCRTGSLVIN